MFLKILRHKKVEERQKYSSLLICSNSLFDTVTTNMLQEILNCISVTFLNTIISKFICLIGIHTNTHSLFILP